MSDDDYTRPPGFWFLVKTYLAFGIASATYGALFLAIIVALVAVWWFLNPGAVCP